MGRWGVQRLEVGRRETTGPRAQVLWSEKSFPPNSWLQIGTLASGCFFLEERDILCFGGEGSSFLFLFNLKDKLKMPTLR